MGLDVHAVRGEPAMAAILARVLGRVAAADRAVHPEEARVLLPLFPGLTADEVTEALTEDPPGPFAPGSLIPLIPDPSRRHGVLRMAVKMAWMDRQVHEAEVRALREIAAALGEPDDDVRRLLGEVVAGPGRVPSTDEVREALAATAWEDLEVHAGPPTSALARVVPAGEVLLAVIRVGSIEQALVTGGGLAAGFVEGDAFVSWAEIRMFTRQSTLSAAVKIDTRDFRMRTVADARMSPLASFLDRALAGLTP